MVIEILLMEIIIVFFIIMFFFGFLMIDVIMCIEFVML